MMTPILLGMLAVAALVIVLQQIRWRREKRQAESMRLEIEAEHERQVSELIDERERWLDALGVAFFLIDAQGRVSYANAAAMEIFGQRELAGRPFREAMLDPRLASAIDECLRTGERKVAQAVLLQQTSPLRDLETRGINAWVIDAAPLTGSISTSKLTRVIIRDVTAEHQLEQIRKDFVANASHELRTPMSIINGYLENLLDDHVVEDVVTTRRFLGVMRKHADRISRIVEDMLTISRLESGDEGSLKMETFPFKDCLNDILERLESLIRQRNAKVSILLDDPGVRVFGDRFYWAQILFNLVENALKQNVGEGLKIEIGCVEREADLIVWVADDGIGIPSADLAHVFRRFYRVDKHHSQQEIKGTGLGLSIVKRAVRAHGGTIEVSSMPGRDTRFTICVPRRSVD